MTKPPGDSVRHEDAGSHRGLHRPWRPRAGSLTGDVLIERLFDGFSLVDARGVHLGSTRPSAA